MSAEQQQTALDADTLGQVAYDALVQQTVRDGIPAEEIETWADLDETARRDCGAVAVAVARAALDAAVAHLRADLGAEMRRRGGSRQGDWAQGYEDAIGELMALAGRLGGEEGQP